MEQVFPWYRLGTVLPFDAHNSMYQSHRIAPEGFFNLFQHQRLTEYTLESVEANLGTLRETVLAMAELQAQRILLAGVPVAAALGRGEALRILGQMESWSGVQASNSFEDHITTLRHLGVSRVAVANRWPEDLNLAVKRYLEDAGFELLSYEYGGGTLSENIKKSPKTDHDTAVTLGRAAVASAPDAEALLLPGGAGFFLHAAPQLEEELGIPVITNHLATLFSALLSFEDRRLAEPDPRWGSVLSRLP